MPAVEAPVGTSYYRMAPIMAARLLGLALVVFAVVAFVATIAVTFAGGDIRAVVIAVLVLVLLTAAATWFSIKAGWIVRADSVGYRVRMLRGAGARSAPWSSVTNISTAFVKDVPTLVLTLDDGRTTSIPTTILAIDKEQFVRELRARAMG